MLKSYTVVTEGSLSPFTPSLRFRGHRLGKSKKKKRKKTKMSEVIRRKREREKERERGSSACTKPHPIHFIV